MKHRWLQLRWLVILLAAGPGGLPVMDSGTLRGADQAPEPPIAVEEAWIRWLPANLPAAGYAAIRNNSDQEIVLTGARSPAYGSVELHESVSTADGNARMLPVERLVIPAHGSVRLQPGGYHLMLMRPRGQVAPGATVTILLTFTGGREFSAPFLVRPANATGR